MVSSILKQAIVFKIVFLSSATMATTYVPGVSANGVSASTEFVKFLATKLTEITFTDVSADMDSGAFRPGLHVKAIGGEGSESMVNSPSEVPLPAAGWLFGLALVGLIRRRKL